MPPSLLVCFWYRVYNRNLGWVPDPSLGVLGNKRLTSNLQGPRGPEVNARIALGGVKLYGKLGGIQSWIMGRVRYGCVLEIQPKQSNRVLSRFFGRCRNWPVHSAVRVQSISVARF